MKLDELVLITGNDIPFGLARMTIHQPRLKEIGFIGEEAFHIGCQFLLFDKNKIADMDKNGLENKDNFDIFMSVMCSPEKAAHKTDALMVLTLLFPEAEIKINKDKILLQLENFTSSINKENFKEFQNILAQIFCLGVYDETEYNPEDALAKRIAEKIKKGKEKLAQKKGVSSEKVYIYRKYLSILGVGLHMSLNDLSEYTIYQIRDQFKRFILETNYDIYVQSKMAGASGIEEVDDWMEDIHP